MAKANKSGDFKPINTQTYGQRTDLDELIPEVETEKLRGLALLQDRGYARGVRKDNRTADELKLTEKDVKGFVKRQKKLQEENKKLNSGLLNLTMTKAIIDDIYSPVISTDYKEPLPIFPGIYRQSTTAIKDKLIAEKLDIAQQQERYDKSLSKNPARNLGMMSPRVVIDNADIMGDFKPIEISGLSGPVVPVPDKPTDINKLPSFSFTGASEMGPSSGGLLRWMGLVGMTSPLLAPKNALGSGFSLKSLMGKADEYVTQELLTSIKKNSSSDSRKVLDAVIEESSINIDNLPVNQSQVDASLANKTITGTNLIKVKDLKVSKSLQDMAITETSGAKDSENVYYNLDRVNVGDGYEGSITGTARDKLPYNKDGTTSFTVTDSIEGIGLEAKGVTSPYSKKHYLHSDVLTDRPEELNNMGALYGHKRQFIKKEIPAGHPTLEQGPAIVKELFADMKLPSPFRPGYSYEERTAEILANNTSVIRDGNPLVIHTSNIYNNITEAKNTGMLSPGGPVTLQRYTINDIEDKSRSVYDTSGQLNNYNSDNIITEFPMELFSSEKFTPEQLLNKAGPGWRKWDKNNVTTADKDLAIEFMNKRTQYNKYTAMLDFKIEMQKIDALLKLVEVPNILKTIQSEGPLKGKINILDKSNRMTIDDVVEHFDNTPVVRDVNKPGGMLMDGKHAQLSEYIRIYANTAIENSFSYDATTIREALGDASYFSLSKVDETTGDWNNNFIEPFDSSTVPHTTYNGLHSLADELDPNYKNKYGAPITVAALKKYVTTIARINKQKEIVAFVPSGPAGPGTMSTYFRNLEDIRNIDEGVGTFFDQLSITPGVFEALQKWEDGGGQRHAQWKSNSVRFKSDKELNELKEIELGFGPGRRILTISEEQYDTFKNTAFSSVEDMELGMQLRREGEVPGAGEREELDPELSDAIGYNLEEGEDFFISPLLRPIGTNIQSASEKAFTYLRRHPATLVEMTTVHNIKQALQNSNLDAIRFNTFATSVKAQDWAQGLRGSEYYNMMNRHVNDAPVEVKSLVNLLFNPEGPMHTQFYKFDTGREFKLVRDDKKKDIDDEIADLIDNEFIEEQTYDKSSSNLITLLQESTGSPSYNEMFNQGSSGMSQPQVYGAIVNRETSNLPDFAPTPSIQYGVYKYTKVLRRRLMDIMENELKAFEFGASDTTPFLTALKGYSNTPVSTREDYTRIMYENGLSADAHKFITSFEDRITKIGKPININIMKKAETVEALEMMNNAMMFMRKFYVRNIEAGMTTEALTDYGYSVQNKTSPLFLGHFGPLKDENLTETIKTRKTSDKPDAKMYNMAFANQYDKYKLEAFKKLGLNYKIVNDFKDRPANTADNVSFYEVELPKNPKEREALLNKIKKHEVQLFSQIMPVPKFNQVNEEEDNTRAMGAT